MAAGKSTDRRDVYCDSPACNLAPKCGASRRAAFFVLGSRGTRRCLVPPFEEGTPEPIDDAAADSIVQRVASRKLAEVVLLGVPRDDLGDGGAAAFARAVRAIREATPRTQIEVYISDFGASLRNLREFLGCRPAVVHHALTTPPRLFGRVLPGSEYVHSVEVLRIVKEECDGILLRSTICLGLGETRDELVATLADLRSVRCDEVLFAPAPHPTAAMPTSAVLDKIATVATKLHFSRVAFLDHARSCVAP
jgi:lipoic acid synthetase